MPERRPKFGSKSGARCSFERGNPNFSTGRRGFDVTATLLALLRHKSRRRRAPRPAAGPPTHAIAGTRARAVTMATVRPPSLLNHITPGGWQAAVRHDTVVSRRRRRHATAASSDFFLRFLRGARQRARLYTSTDSLSNDGGPGAEYADCADCGPRFPPLRPCAPRRATAGLPTPIATTAAPARVPPGPGRQHVGPDHRLIVTKVTVVYT